MRRWIHLCDIPKKNARQKGIRRGFPGGSVVKNPPPVQETGFNPWSRKIPRCAEQLSPCAQVLSLCSRAREPQLLKSSRLEPGLRTKRRFCHEKPAHPN